MSGLFGICGGEPDGSGSANLTALTYHALFALQHRGQESCGIAVCDDGVIHYIRDLGLVSDVFTPEKLARLGSGNMAMGHVRFAAGEQHWNRSLAQPLVVRHSKGNMAVALSGSLTNAAELRIKLEESGAIFHTNGDAEIISSLIAGKRLDTESIEDAVKAATLELKGAFSFIVMSATKMIVARDTKGFRPLCFGMLNGNYVIASESCAIDCLGGTLERDVAPGEVILFEKGKMQVVQPGVGKPTGMCIFEFIYFARQDSVIEGVSVHLARRKAGMALAENHPPADIVIGVPESGLDAALGYAQKSGIEYGMGFIKNRYIGRTFIQPVATHREQSVDIKLNAIADTVKDKRVIMIDDSIVRGTTTRKNVKKVRHAGASSLHMRIAAPPFKFPCYFGADEANPNALIAGKMSIEEICEYIGADSLEFLSVEFAKQIEESCGCTFCTGCFTGEYPAEKPATTQADRYSQKISMSGDRVR